MAVQIKTDNNGQPLVLHGQSYVQTKTLVTNAGRTTVLKPFTVLCEIAASKKVTPFVNAALTTGASIPCYIYVGETITAAAIVAGDVTDLPVLFGGYVVVDENQVVFDDGTLNADTVIGASSVWAQTARKVLEAHGIVLKGTEDISYYEN